MSTRRDLERELGRFQLPGPPPELARRVLAAAGQRLVETPRLSALERIWASRTLRWAWVASVVLTLLAGASGERRLERQLEAALGPREGAGVAIGVRPESLDLDPSWAPRLALSARAASESRARAWSVHEE